MAIVGSYTVHLYCDTGGDAWGASCPNAPKSWETPMSSYEGTNERDCLKQARRDGWTFKNNETLAHCPKCSKGLKPS